MDRLLPELGIVVEADLGVTDKDTAICKGGQRVDFNHGAIAIDENLVQVCYECGCLLDLPTRVAHLCGHFFGDLGSHSHLDVHRLLDYCGGVGGGDVLDRCTTCLAAYQQRASAATVHQYREILLRLDGNLLSEKQNVVWLALRACLLSDQSLAEHLISHLANFGLRDDVHAALEAVLLEVTQAAASGQDLGLHHDFVARKICSLLHGLLDREDRCVLRHPHSEVAEYLLRLILVQVQEAALDRPNSRRHHRPAPQAAA
mmetsp:Transcript_135171/g.341988  ORF Transcript_135171/g.341988 Transcript_135171/m.341988 type:complete len:259 (+) Transcript_135171:629-1405(+)